MLENIIKRIKLLWAKSSSERYCTYLRSKGVYIGEGTYISSRTCLIDITRPSLVTIGKNCYINERFTLLTHDYTTKVFLHMGKGFINSSGCVTIGDNVSFGQNVMVLKGVTIGDNCFIGAGSVVTKDIPANAVAVGAPCKVIMTIDEYYKKRQRKCEAEAFEYARSINDRFGRKPVIGDFWEEFHFFVSGSEVEKFPEIPIRRQLGPDYENYVKNHIAKYASFDDFLKEAGIDTL